MREPIQMLEARELKFDPDQLYWEECYYDKGGRLQSVRTIQVAPIQNPGAEPAQGLRPTYQVRMQIHTTIGNWNQVFFALNHEAAVHIYNTLKGRQIQSIYPEPPAIGNEEGPSQRRGFWGWITRRSRGS